MKLPLKSKADYSPAQWKRLKPETKRAINKADKEKAEAKEKIRASVHAPIIIPSTDARPETPDETIGNVLTSIRQHAPEQQLEIVKSLLHELSIDFINRSKSSSDEANRQNDCRHKFAGLLEDTLKKG